MLSLIDRHILERPRLPRWVPRQLDGKTLEPTLGGVFNLLALRQ